MEGLFSFEGRMRRKDLWISGLITPVVAVVLLVFIILIAKLISTLLAILIAAVLVFGMLIHALAENTKRCHDISLSGWFQLIPFFEFVLLFKAGDIGPNKYGPDPKAVDLKKDDDLNFRRPRSQFDEEMAAIRAERGM
jgi:uncharacterized membrane protein YhaH (DUF805 family)